MRTTKLIAEKKARNIKRLSERYYGKRALLDEWELFPDTDPDYLRDLRRRVHGHQMDLVYRGVDDAADL